MSLDANSPVITGFRGTDRFVVRAPLGAGGMGMVYRAYDHERGAEVALKILRERDGEAVLHLKREFRALRDVVHPNLVSLGALVEDGGRWFLTMELVDGVEFVDHVRGGARARAGLGDAPTRPLPPPSASPAAPRRRRSRRRCGRQEADRWLAAAGVVDGPRLIALLTPGFEPP